MNSGRRRKMLSTLVHPLLDVTSSMEPRMIAISLSLPAREKKGIPKRQNYGGVSTSHFSSLEYFYESVLHRIHIHLGNFHRQWKPQSSIFGDWNLSLYISERFIRIFFYQPSSRFFQHFPDLLSCLNCITGRTNILVTKKTLTKRIFDWTF